MVNSAIEAERDHLRVGDHYVRLMTMKKAIAETRPLVFNQLLKIEASFYVVTEWTPLATAKARKQVNAKRRHFSLSKTRLIQSAQEEKLPERDRLVDESKQADVEALGDCLRALGEAQTMGESLLTIVLFDQELETVSREAGKFHSLFTNLDGGLFTETYNQLNAYFAIVLGNHAHNLRRMYLLNNNYADLSFSVYDPSRRDDERTSRHQVPSRA